MRDISRQAVRFCENHLSFARGSKYITPIPYDIDRLSEDRAFWTRLGVAWICKDGSINVKLKAHNLTGEYNLQPRKDDDKG